MLAVSGIMFLVAANFINGKQQKTSFTNGVNEMVSRIQDTIEQVSDGEYSDIPFTCSVSGGSLRIGLGGAAQGTNPDCVFIGKFMHFSQSGEPSSYEVFSLAAARSSTSLGPDVTPVLGGGIDLTDQQTVPQNLKITTAGVRISGRAGKFYGFGFTQSQGSQDAVTGTYTSGAQTIGLVYSAGLRSSSASESSAAGFITGTVAPAAGASFCLTDDTRYAKIDIGGTNNASPLDVNVTISGDKPPSC